MPTAPDGWAKLIREDVTHGPVTEDRLQRNSTSSSGIVLGLQGRREVEVWRAHLTEDSMKLWLLVPLLPPLLARSGLTGSFDFSVVEKSAWTSRSI